MSITAAIEPQNTKKALFYNTQAKVVSSLVLSLVVFLGSYERTEAGIFDIFGVPVQAAEESGSIDLRNSQTLPILEPTATALSESTPRQIALSVSDDALEAKAGPLGTEADSLEHENIETADISFYVVQKGDTVSSLAEMFEITADTIRWANNLPTGSNALKAGTTLDIPPVSGVVYDVKSGDSLISIAKKFGSNVSEIGKWNGLERDSKLAVGDTIVVPNGKISGGTAAKKQTPGASSLVIKTGTIGSLLARVSGPDLGTYYGRPIRGGIRTQGIHGRTAVDIGAKIGTEVVASASGKVIIAKSSGYNWGYGKFVVIAHPNGTQTIYAHMSQVNVSVGAQVTKGQTIGLVGSTGRSTGPHLHFEVRGAKNPLGANANYGL